MKPSEIRVEAEPPPSPTEFNRSVWFSENVLPHESALRAWLQSHFPTLAESDDVVQESFVRLWQAKKPDRLSNAKSYLFKIARNITFDLFRRERSNPIIATSEDRQRSVIEDRIGVAEAVCNSQEFNLLRQAIESLPERCRVILTLQKLHGFSNQEIAQKLGLSVNTVNAQLVIGLARCRQYLLARGVLRGRSK
jgi:RNA polymerase sigma factor (sigma-70 family)